MKFNLMQLNAACQSPEYLTRLLAGETSELPDPRQTLRGTELGGEQLERLGLLPIEAPHTAALERCFLAHTGNLLVQLGEGTGPRAVSQPAALLQQLYSSGADTAVQGLLAQGRVDAAAQLVAGFYAYAVQLQALLEQSGQPPLENGAVRAVFFRGEAVLRDRPLEVTPAGALQLYGRIPGLRLEAGEWVLAAQRLWAQAEEGADSTVTLALYQHVVSQLWPERSLRCVRESYAPEFRSEPVPTARLQQVYAERVAPVLQRLAGVAGPALTRSLSVEPAGSSSAVVPLSAGSGAEPVVEAGLVSGADPGSVDPAVEPPGPGRCESLAVDEAPLVSAAVDAPETLAMDAALQQAVEVELDAEAFRRHLVVLGGAGSGKTELALSMVEQALESDVPVLMVDRHGDLARYADPAAWQVEDQPERNARRHALFARLKVVLYTPGHGGGRALRWSLLPTRGALREEQASAEQTAVAADLLADLMRLAEAPEDAELRRALRQLIAAVCRGSGPWAVADLVRALRDANAGFWEQCPLVYAQRDALLERLVAFEWLHRDWADADGEWLDGSKLLGLEQRAPGEPLPLTIIQTSFLEGERAVAAWLFSLLGELNRTVAVGQPSKGLRGLILLDEADLYLPDHGPSATREALIELLERAPAAGIGVILAARHPADLDFEVCAGRVQTWLVGRLRERRALAKLQPKMVEIGVDAEVVFPAQQPGQFHLIHQDRVTRFQAERALLDPEPLSGREILALARATRESPRVAPTR